MDDATATWILAAKAAFLAEGFKRELKQFRKPGQVWGVVRQEDDDMQIHIRAFRDGRLESEVELSNKYIQHLWSHRRNAAEEVKEILERHGMPTREVSETFIPITGSGPDKQMPTGRTRNTHGAAAVIVGLGLLFGRHYLQKAVFRAVPGVKAAKLIKKP